MDRKKSWMEKPISPGMGWAIAIVGFMVILLLVGTDNLNLKQAKNWLMIIGGSAAILVLAGTSPKKDDDTN